MQIHLTVPDSLLDQDKQELEKVALEALIVRLYSLGDLSSGEGAESLGISRREFLDLLGRYNVSIFDETVDLEREASYE
jgi:predicted HTH domain antitoxin